MASVRSISPSWRPQVLHEGRVPLANIRVYSTKVRISCSTDTPWPVQPHPRAVGILGWRTGPGQRNPHVRVWTPACAGLTSSSRPRTASCGLYPRVRGADVGAAITVSTVDPSTPAYAGLTRRPARWRHWWGLYPRMHGADAAT